MCVIVGRRHGLWVPFFFFLWFFLVFGGVGTLCRLTRYNTTPFSDSLRDPVQDWIEAAKEKQREAEETVAREKELADLAAQEERMKEAQAKQLAQEEEFNRKALEAARKRDELRDERQRQREENLQARTKNREDTQKAAEEALEMMMKANEDEQRQRDEKETELQQKREAQRARIAAMMSRVKGSSRTSTPVRSTSPDEEL